MGNDLAGQRELGRVVSPYLPFKISFQLTIPSLVQGDETHDQWLATLDLRAAFPKGQLRLTIDTSFSESEIYLANGGTQWYDSGVVARLPSTSTKQSTRSTYAR